MSSPQEEQSYYDDGFADIYEAQDSFGKTFDLENPAAAASAYARIMHEHTKRQLQIATRSANRRTPAEDANTATLQTSPSTDSTSSEASTRSM